MQAHTTQSPLSSPFRVMMLADSEAMLPPAVNFIRCVAGGDATILIVPHVCGIAGGAPLALDLREVSSDGSPVQLVSPEGERLEEPKAIGDLALKRNVDLIVVATNCGPEGSLQDPCGAAQLALDCPIPVMVLHCDPTYDASFPPVRRLVVPLDGSARAAQSLPITLRLAQRLGVPVHLVMVIDPARVLPPAYAYDPEAMDNALTDLRETAHWALKQVEYWIRREQVTVESVLLYGPVSTCIQSAIDEGDMVLMTTHGVGRGSGGGMGSVAARMLETVRQPLVIMRGMAPGEVVVEGYQACPWIEPLTGSGSPADVRANV